MMRTPGRSLELFYIDGHADGMLTAELYNWTGHVLMAPRTQLGDALKRSEPKCTGVYLLLGEQSGEPLAYIGESDDVGQRLKNHDLKKDWWTSVVFITTAGNKLNKAHARYLESRLIAEAKRIGRMPLDNATTPPLPSLSEADIAKMEAFLDNLLTVLPAVRVDMFIERARSSAPAFPNTGPQSSISSPLDEVSKFPDATGVVRFQLELPRKDFVANAELNERGEFIVLAGSQARHAQKLGSYQRLYDEVHRTGVIASDERGRLHFTANYVFDSPSAAASVATGTSMNGAIAWREIGTGRTYKEWEALSIGSPGDLAERLLKDLGL